MPPVLISKLAEYTTITGSAYVPIVDVNETIASKNKKISVNDLRKIFYSAGITLSSSFIKHTPGFYYFGDNRDGDGIFTGSISTVRTLVSKSFKSTQDGPAVIKNFSSLFISRSVIVKPTNRCRGMLVFVDGDATISGSLTMTARGAKFTGSDSSFQVLNPPYLGDYWTTTLFPSSSYLSRVFAVGGSGGAGYTPGSTGQPGTVGSGGKSGGGGGGGGQAPMAYTGGAGAAGTSFSGGSGGGGGVTTPYGFGGTAAYAYGGAGGPTSGPSGGGAGNPAGDNGFSNAKGGEGTGGLMILIVRGNLKIGPNGSITADGSVGGGNGSGGGGGGSGGGVLYVYYGGRLTNNGTVTANGGTGGTGAPTGAWNGGSGGAGTVTISRLNTAFPVIN